MRTKLKGLNFVSSESPGPAQEPLFATGIADGKAGQLYNVKIKGRAKGIADGIAGKPTHPLKRGNLTFYSFNHQLRRMGIPRHGNKEYPKHFAIAS